MIALWKDPTGVREIPLDPGSHAVLLTVSMDRATRYTADRRWPVDNSTFSYLVAVHQIQASEASSGTTPAPSSATAVPVLEAEELTILTAWAEGVSESAAYAPERLRGLLTEARAGASWRTELGIPEPSPRLADAIESLSRVTEPVAAPPATSLFDALLTAAGEDRPDEGTLDGLVRQALLSMLEERRTREPTQVDSAR
jgi:hypothetical protein